MQGSLVVLGGNLEHPRDAKPSDFPAVGPSGAAGMAEGAGKLVKLSLNQEGPRHAQDTGEQTPSRWTVEGYTVEKNKGEGGTASTAVSIKGSLDLETGQMVPNAKEQTY